MPRRPSAVCFAADERYILVGDKFGDVYSLPLIQNHEDDAAFQQQMHESSTPFSSKPKGPAATELTVHSMRNRKVLEQQLKEDPVEKLREPLKFVHQILLGHVSMLTDLVSVTTVDPNSQRSKSYIITADRDEHIRVSRGAPQAHIIENFCLGHRQFVSKLCLINQDILASGGGDDDLFIWNWKQSKILTKISIASMIGKDDSGEEVEDCTHDRVAVSYLRSFQQPQTNSVRF
jgi:tRNA (guanine-N(7)-)-methyltransferase subunit TRM82